MIRGFTTLDESNFVYEWKINKMDYFLDSKTEDFIYSDFSLSAIGYDQWRIESTFNPNKDNVDFHLCLIYGGPLHARFSSFVLDNKKDKNFTTTDVVQHYINNDKKICLSLPKKTLLDDKDKYLPDNTLTICVDLTVFKTPTTTSKKLVINFSKRGMAHDYQDLYNTKMGCDTIINVGDYEFQAHKTILMARSPVLAAMFSHDMIEKKENKISVPDITPEIFEKILKYIYTDQVIDLNEIADDLLEVADKYQLQSLKEMCQESLSETLILRNALKIMTLADRHSAKELLDFTIRFMATNMKDLIETQEFKEFSRSNLAGAFELMKKLSSYRFR
ncbi:speckle-type POZ protein-like isoform X2 [Microplitis mediator]|uniref:speckle-type POZ protein-like isoform X2 n=1 Tax=Microplitis mediator TaxID=375433 RepID=UPI0025551905|nr:speckle-type POZ protein-like isoform X2 [Microplitis mediator]